MCVRVRACVCAHTHAGTHIHPPPPTPTPHPPYTCIVQTDEIRPDNSCLNVAWKSNDLSTNKLKRPTRNHLMFIGHMSSAALSCIPTILVIRFSVFILTISNYF